MHGLRRKKAHTAGRNGEMRHGFAIPCLNGSLHLKAASFEREPLPRDMCEHTFEDEMLPRRQPMLDVLGASRRRKLGEGEIKGREKGENPAEFHLSSVSIIQNDTNQPLLDHAKATLLPAIPSLLSKPLFSSA